MTYSIELNVDFCYKEENFTILEKSLIKKGNERRNLINKGDHYMKMSGLFQSVQPSIKEASGNVTEMFNVWKQRVSEHPYGIVSLHSNAPYCEYGMEHPYTYVTPDFELAKRENLERIERIKQSNDAKIISATETDCHFCGTFENEHYGNVSYENHYWLDPIVKVDDFELKAEKVTILSLRIDKGEADYLGAYSTFEAAWADLESFIQMIDIPNDRSEQEQYQVKLSANRVLLWDDLQSFLYDFNQETLAKALDCSDFMTYNMTLRGMLKENGQTIEVSLDHYPVHPKTVE